MKCPHCGYELEDDEVEDTIKLVVQKIDYSKPYVKVSPGKKRFVINS